VDNLVDNALRHGGVARLGCRWVDGWAEVTVDDDGPGIPPAQLERVFQPWVRLPEGTGASGSGSGSGLGLAIARDLAQRDGGTLTLDNRPEGGLRVRLRIPLE